MLSILQFLNRVLPQDGDGERCWVGIKKGERVRQGFASTNEQLEIALRGIDSNQWNAFFACSSFKEPTNREADNSKSAKAFWMDIDAGKGKPYEDVDAAMDALDNFIARASLPRASICVCSGNGVHAYWVLEEAISTDLWLPVAKNLKLLTASHGFDADPARTADRASILRPIQTMNWKDPANPKEVYIIEENPDVPFAYLRRSIGGVETPPYLPRTVPNFEFGEMPKGPPSMVQGFGDGERTHALTVRAGWCLGPGRMTEEEAIEACLAWNDHNTPPLDKEKIVKTVQSIKKREVSKPVAPGAQPLPFEEPPEKLPPLPDGYRWGNRLEIMSRVKNPDYGPDTPHEPTHIETLVCEFPFYIEALRAEETNGSAGAQSVKIVCKSPHEPWRSFVIPRGELLGATWVKSLGVYGVVCEPGQEKKFKDLIHKMTQIKRKTIMIETSYKSFGWKENRAQFIAGRRAYSSSGVTVVSGTSEFEKAADLISPKANGSINKWRIAANRIFSPGCEAQQLAMLASFASPFMDMLFTGAEGGSILSLRSTKGGQGKTTAIAAAETVWGQSKCLRLTEQESLAAQFRAIGIRGNMPVMIDEWGTGSIESVADRVKIFTGGLDKKRLAISGEDTREQLSWKNVLIGTTNLPILNMLHDANYGAQADRIFEVNMNIPEYLAGTQSSSLIRDFEDNAGLAGPIFLAYVLKNFNLDAMQAKLNTLAEQFGERCRAGTDERFKTRLIAAITMAGSILSKPMIGGEPMAEFNPIRLLDYSLGLIKEGRSAYTGKKTFSEQLMSFIMTNMQNFVNVPREYRANKEYFAEEIILPRGGLMGRYERDNGKLYIPHDIIHRYAVSIRVSYMEFAKELTEKGLVLNRNRKTTLSAGVKALSPVQVSCWEIDMFHEDAGGAKVEADKKFTDMAVNSKLNRK